MIFSQPGQVATLQLHLIRPQIHNFDMNHMSEIRTIESIKRHARAAVDQLDTLNTPPVNPFVPGTIEHKRWTREFLEHGSKAAPANQAA